MVQVFYHCSNTEGVLVDQCGTAADDLVEACEHAAAIVGSLVMAPNLEDWRGWVLHVSDELGEEIFTVPFASMLGKLQ
jgi:hypothetical protein